MPLSSSLPARKVSASSMRRVGRRVSMARKNAGELAQNTEEGAFAAAVFGGFDTEINAYIPQVEGVGVQVPKGDGFRHPFGQDDEPVESGDDVVQEGVGVHRVGPGLDILDFEGQVGRR